MALLALSVHNRMALQSVPLKNSWLLSILFGHRKSTNVDAIDSYISELVENKTLKWQVLNNKNRLLRKSGQNQAPKTAAIPAAQFVNSKSSSFRITQIFDDLTSNPLVINIEPLEQIHIDNLVETAIEEGNAKDIYLLFDQMLDYCKLPSKAVLEAMFKYFAEELDKKRMEQLIDLCQKADPEGAVKSNGFLHFRALLLWKSGSSLNALETFKEALKLCSLESRDEINHLLKEVIDETIGKKSEAVLLAVLEMGEFCMLEMRDEFVLCYAWERSFLSQWYSDQEAAKTLFNKHVSLRNAIAKRLSKLCFTHIQQLNTEPIYRLMELFLRHKMLAQCQQILVRLFEYQYWRKDLRACSEIMQNSIDLDIPLPDIYNQKLLDLLLGRPSTAPRMTPPESDVKRKDPLKVKKYELKF